MRLALTLFASLALLCMAIVPAETCSAKDNFSARGLKVNQLTTNQKKKLTEPNLARGMKMKDSATSKAVALNDAQILVPKNQKTTVPDKAKVPVNKIAEMPKLMLKNTSPPKAKLASAGKSNKLNPPLDFKSH